jgi:UDP-N-acetylglucosamine 4,6-dehydratase/5-epimerase
MLNRQTILITGGTGSFGKKFTERILLNYQPKKVIIFSRDELKQYEMQNSPPFNKYRHLIRYVIGDVRDIDRLKYAMENVDYVVHTAAMKQIQVAEFNPFEAVKTNIIGGQNVIDACIHSGIKKVLCLSTDKAVAPNSLYGATKLASDKLFIAANSHQHKRGIKFSIVRCGNVMGSNASVIPFFQKQKSSGTIPVTDERMTRFNISLQEWVDFAIMVLDRMWGGEIYIPKMPSYKITDLAKAIAPDSKIKFTGIRPGEKLHEELITESDSLSAIEFDDYFVILPLIDERIWDVEKFRTESCEKPGKFCTPGFMYNSGTNFEWLTIGNLKELIKLNID